ncbi:DUF3885 domain-containing protein [Clostridium sp. CF012]|uniref:DUF3885 domain-containing protein n=1 Tax=Clostridium sp. CF012 TaxID=2843319 RepID=UPI001C0E269E|nr:DUF3885 domain-containing protein [Clostridium sp. CF012]MBU3146330.1 DUF3885 domain-containing protein [Clostridium sp. CF012]
MSQTKINEQQLHIITLKRLFIILGGESCCLKNKCNDDRGLDIVAHDKNTLMPLYQELNAWILDYDREQIDERFSN